MADFNEVFNEFNSTPDATPCYEQTDINNNRVMAILAYLSWLVLIPLLAAKDSPFARFHCNQGLMIAIVELIAGVAFGILNGLPLIGWVFTLLQVLFSLVCVLFSILGIVNAANGKAKELPIIGGIRIMK